MLSAFCNLNCKCTTFDICSLCQNMLLICDADIDEKEDKKWSHCLEALSCVYTSSSNSKNDDVGQLLFRHGSSNSSMASVVSILCKHYSVNSCDCLTEDKKTNTLFRYHNVKECKLELHQDSPKNGYYLIEKPVWKNCCESPYESKDPFTLKVEKLMDVCNFKHYSQFKVQSFSTYLCVEFTGAK